MKWNKGGDGGAAAGGGDAVRVRVTDGWRTETNGGGDA